MAFAQRWHGVHHDVIVSTPRRLGGSFILLIPVAFARRCHGVHEALSRRLLRLHRLSLTASNGVFPVKKMKKDMQILKMIKANKTLFKSDAHTCIRFSFKMSAGLLLVIRSR